MRVEHEYDRSGALAYRASADRMAQRWPTATLVHLPTHASWLNHIEIYFSVLLRKALTPNDFYDLSDIKARLMAFQDRYNFTARPFHWTYTRHDLDGLLKRIAAHEAQPQTTAQPPTN